MDVATFLSSAAACTKAHKTEVLCHGKELRVYYQREASYQFCCSQVMMFLPLLSSLEVSLRVFLLASSWPCLSALSTSFGIYQN
jgi:hypothetical protein